MSLKLNSSGGGSVTLQEPTTASNVTLNLPAADGTVVYENASGNVGIGTSSPGARLHARQDSAGATTYAIYTDNGAAGAGTNVAGIGFANAGAMKSSITAAVYGNDFIAFNVGGSGTTERARIDSSGNLLVGKTTPNFSSAGLELKPNGEVFINFGTSNVPTGIRRDNDGAVMNFFRGASSVGSISVTASATTYATSSDYRLKHDIQPMTGALAKVAQLKPVTYKWSADNSESQGFIAHELQEVVPECVTGEKDAVDAEGNPVYQGIDTSFLVATLTAAIQEQQAMIEELKAKIAALEAQ